MRLTCVLICLDWPVQFAFDDLRVEAPACLNPPCQQPEAAQNTEAATLSDYLHAWGGLVSARLRLSRAVFFVESKGCVRIEKDRRLWTLCSWLCVLCEGERGDAVVTRVRDGPAGGCVRPRGAGASTGHVARSATFLANYHPTSSWSTVGENTLSIRVHRMAHASRSLPRVVLMVHGVDPGGSICGLCV